MFDHEALSFLCSGVRVVKQEPMPQRRMPNSFQRGRCRFLIYQSHPRWRFEGRWLNGPRR
jgi:hypothetical protein